MVKKVLALLFLLFIIILLALACSRDKEKIDKPPEIEVTINGKQIDYVVGLDEWNRTKYDREDTFSTIIKERSKNDIKNVNLGDIIEIKFKEHTPKTASLYDHLIKVGINEQQFLQNEIAQIESNYKDDKMIYQINTHMAYSESMNIEEYKGDDIFRGFRFICSWKENKCEYAFIVKTNTP